MATASRVESRRRRHQRIRRKIVGSAERPRMALYKSNTALSVQFIDDDAGVTLASVRSRTGAKNMEAATSLGKEAAAAAKDKGITRVVVDRGGFPFHGRLKAVVDAAVSDGLVISEGAPAAGDASTEEA